MFTKPYMIQVYTSVQPDLSIDRHVCNLHV